MHSEAKQRLYFAFHRPVDMRTNVVSILPPSPSLSTYSQQPPLSITTSVHPHRSLSPERHLSIPINSQLSLPTTTSFASEMHTPSYCSHVPIIPMYSLSSSMDWSVADVGQFIEKHFPGKNIARVNPRVVFSSLQFDFLIYSI